MATVADLIYKAFLNLAVIQPGEILNATIQNQALPYLLDMQASWIAEDLMNYNAVELGYTLVQNVDTYTLGIGGTFDTFAQNVHRVTSWNARSGNFKSGGRIVTIDEFHALANPNAEAATLPKLVAADTHFPLINIRVHPFPAPVYGGSTMAAINLQGWYNTPAFGALGDSVDNLPPGYINALHYNLAIALSPQYARVGGVTPELMANATNSKGVIVAKNAAILGFSQQPQAQQPAA
jgi:hypothetical protein